MTFTTRLNVIGIYFEGIQYGNFQTTIMGTSKNTDTALRQFYNLLIYISKLRGYKIGRPCLRSF
ncbi:hypothetical protein BH10BAC3_BH10BAC3_37190 [soil metagenome]